MIAESIVGVVRFGVVLGLCVGQHSFLGSGKAGF